MEKDYYKILGVEKNATDQEIRKAYLKLSKKYHPDMQSGKSDAEKKEAEEKFKELNEANEILSNKEKRQYYDNFGSAPGQHQSGGGGFGGFDPRNFFRQHASHFGGFNPFGDDFGYNPFGNQNTNHVDPNAPQDGGDVQIKIKIPFEEVIYGTIKEFDLNFDDRCDHCKGTGSEDGQLDTCPSCHGIGMITQRNGFMVVQSTCPNCHGEGHVIKTKCHKCNGTKYIKVNRHLKIQIPKGIDNGETIYIDGEGRSGVNGGKSGSIRIVVFSEDSDIFERDGLNLAVHANVSPIKMILGGNIDIPTPWGIASLTIPEYTDNGKVFRMRGYGVRTKKGDGDLFVKLNIETLKKLNSEQIDTLKRFEDTLTSDNLPKSEELKEKIGNLKKHDNS